MKATYFLYFLVMWPIFFLARPSTPSSRVMALMCLIGAGMYLAIKKIMLIYPRRKNNSERDSFNKLEKMMAMSDISLLKAEQSNNSLKVDVNQASIDELMKLPISEEDALIILELRDKDKFTNLNEFAGRLNLNPEKASKISYLITFSS